MIPSFVSRYLLIAGLIASLIGNTYASAAINGKDLISGKTVQLKTGKQGTVLVFLSSECPCSNSHIEILKKLSTDFPTFAFAAVHSNADETEESARQYFKTANLPFPVIHDSSAKLADQYKALKTPHSFLLGKDDQILYQGGVTNSSTGGTADRHPLREALNDLVAGKPIAVTSARTLGCMIDRSSK